jgi:ABC-2 type transport system permease protein
MLLLTLLCAPFFILLYKLIFLEGMTVYPVVINTEQVNNSDLSNDFIDVIKSKKYPGGGKLFNIKSIDSYQIGIDILERHEAKIMVNFISMYEVTIIGDFSDPYFVISSNLIRKSIIDFYMERFSLDYNVKVNDKALGISRDKTEFENYVPGLFIFSTLIQLYLFTLLLLREKESKVYIRYYLCSVSKLSYFIGHSIVFFALSIIGLLITTVTAYSLGFQSPNSMIYDITFSIFICSILTLGVIGISFIISTITDSVIHGLLITTFPFMFMVFFSGSVYPFPKIIIAEIFGYNFALFDLIPATHAVNILHKVLTYGTSIIELSFELLLLFILSIILFFIGLYRIKLK